MNRYIRLFNTVKYLKSMQIYYRLFYLLRAKFRKLIGFKYPFSVDSNSVTLVLKPSIASYKSIDNKTFDFLNLSHIFKDTIEWNFSEYGKLWTYNLNYFDFLQQDKMSKDNGLKFIYDFIDNSNTLEDGLEPFPISLRGINWVKFLSNHKIKDEKIDNSLYAQYMILMDNLEYHLLGNHLLENGFSLLFGAYYFEDEKLYNKAKTILVSELEEQILEDGAHFELSPMYHQIMLFRVLDCINLVQGSNFKDQELLTLLESKAKIMLGWLKNITYSDGSIPLLNDSSNGIVPTSKELFQYAKDLELQIEEVELKSSGYRKIVNNKYECIVDVGHIGPSYIPGHAHADTFNFELMVNSKLFIVDSGLSTYETNERRFYERGTAAHNTVEVCGDDSSEVWGGFRVAKRAYVTDLYEDEKTVRATHDGYVKKFDTLHTREWSFEKDKVTIKDSLSKKTKAIARLHFHPDVSEDIIKKHIIVKNSKIINYQYAVEFNKLIDAKVLEIEFEKELEVTITL